MFCPLHRPGKECPRGCGRKHTNDESLSYHTKIGSKIRYPVCVPCEEGKKEQACEEEDERGSSEEEEDKLLMKVRVGVERRLVMRSTWATTDG